jgi:hypothetical protein
MRPISFTDAIVATAELGVQPFALIRIVTLASVPASLPPPELELELVEPTELPELAPVEFAELDAVVLTELELGVLELEPWLPPPSPPLEPAKLGPMGLPLHAMKKKNAAKIRIWTFFMRATLP